MILLREFFKIYLMYCQEIWLSLAAGFLISGFFFKFISTKIVERYLGEGGLRPIFLASVVGTILPVCCIGSLPIALTLRRKGATLGAVLAFMVATPATSISALVVSWKLLGAMFTIIIFCGVIVMAVVMGIVINALKFKAGNIKPEPDSCCQNEALQKDDSKALFGQKAKEAVIYAFVTLPKEIGVEIIIGIAIAAIA